MMRIIMMIKGLPRGLRRRERHFLWLGFAMCLFSFMGSFIQASVPPPSVSGYIEELKKNPCVNPDFVQAMIKQEELLERLRKGEDVFHQLMSVNKYPDGRYIHKFCSLCPCKPGGSPGANPGGPPQNNEEDDEFKQYHIGFRQRSQGSPGSGKDRPSSPGIR